MVVLSRIALWTGPPTSAQQQTGEGTVAYAVGYAIGVGLVILIPIAIVALIVFLVWLPAARMRRAEADARALEQAERVTGSAARRAQEEAQRQAAYIDGQRQEVAAEAWRRAAQEEAQRQAAHEEGQRPQAEASANAAGRGAAQAAADQARREDLVTSFGPEVADRIVRREIWQGMSAEMLTKSRGTPSDIDEKVLKTGTQHIYKYTQSGASRYALRVTLDDGVVVDWNDES